MHELGLVSGILDVAVKTAREAGASRVVSVSLRIGDMAEVNEESMDFAWDILREDDPLTAEATMQVEYVRPRSVCVQCGNEFEHDRFHLRCPACGSGQTMLLAGREMDIVSMEIETPDEDDEDEQQDGARCKLVAPDEGDEDS